MNTRRPMREIAEALLISQAIVGRQTAAASSVEPRKQEAA
jgi:hypothetical protein